MCTGYVRMIILCRGTNIEDRDFFSQLDKVFDLYFLYCQVAKLIFKITPQRATLFKKNKIAILLHAIVITRLVNFYY